MIASYTLGGAENPTLLNFAVFGTITFTINGSQYECKDMRLGQGHTFIFDNWWIGGDSCSSPAAGSNELKCSKPSSCGISFHSNGKTDRFQVAVIDEGEKAYPNHEVKVSADPPENFIYFDGVESVSWTEDRHSITDGQPYTGSSAKGAAIDVVAGRSGSGGPAADFSAGLTAENIIASDYFGTTTQTPTLLNFAVFGTVTFTINGEQYECKDMRIGQGNYEVIRHNWWIGGDSCSSTISAGGVLNCKQSSCGLSFHSIHTSDRFQVAVIHEGEEADPKSRVEFVV